MTNDPSDRSPPPADSPAIESFSLYALPGSGVPAAELPVAFPYQDPLTEEVARALEQPPPQRTWIQSALLLGITLVLFAAAGFFQTTPTDLALIVAVLLLHESGHYLGMRLFNYQDVRMFFIPFFGAAVSGRPTSVAGYQEAIVLLLGPLPGIVLGAGLGIVCMFYDSAALRSAALMLLAINGFNLLPLLPLDGGRLLHLIVFSRQRHVEVVFRVVTAVLLGLCAWALGAWLLAVPAVFILLGAQLNFYVSKLAQQLRAGEHPGGEMNLSQRIPRERSVPLIHRVRQTFPAVVQAVPLANIVRQVWERLHLRPPGLAASLLLLAIYAASFVGTPLLAVLFLWPLTSVVAADNAQGQAIRREEVRSWGRLRQFTELGPDGDYHGRHVELDPESGRLEVEGSYADGLEHGLWTYYDEDGQVALREEFERGVQAGMLPP